MKKPIPPRLQAPVRNLSETYDKGIVSYIPFKFSFKNLTKITLCKKLPTAYFSYYLKNSSDSECWRIFAPVVHFCTKDLITAYLNEQILSRIGGGKR